MNFKIAGLVVGVVVMAPILVLNVWGLRMSFWVTQVQVANQAAQNGDTDVQFPDLPFSSVLSVISSVRERAEVARAFNPTELNKTRIVRFTDSVSLDDMLLPDEAAPVAEFRQLYANARAPRYMMRHCEDIFASLGQRCQVISTVVSEEANGRFSVQAALAYVPDYDIGTPANAEGAKLLRLYIRAPYIYPEQRVSIDTYQNRVLYLLVAEAACAPVRVQYGNCVVGEASLRSSNLSDWDRGKLGDVPAGRSFDAVFRFRVFAPKAAEGAIEALLNETVAEALHP